MKVIKKEKGAKIIPLSKAKVLGVLPVLIKNRR